MINSKNSLKNIKFSEESLKNIKFSEELEVLKPNRMWYHYHRLPYLHALILASTYAYKAHVEGGAGKGSTCAFKKRM